MEHLKVLVKECEEVHASLLFGDTYYITKALISQQMLYKLV